MSAKKVAVPDELEMSIPCDSDDPEWKNMQLSDALGSTWNDYHIERIEWILNDDKASGRWRAVLRKKKKKQEKKTKK